MMRYDQTTASKAGVIDYIPLEMKSFSMNIVVNDIDSISCSCRGQVHDPQSILPFRGYHSRPSVAQIHFHRHVF